MKKTLTLQQVIKEVTVYTEKRKDLRKALLTELRERHKAGKLQLDSSDQRKLYHYPTDFTDAKLLEMLNR